MSELAKIDEGRFVIVRAEARQARHSEALNEAIAKEGQKHRADIGPPAVQGGSEPVVVHTPVVPSSSSTSNPFESRATPSGPENVVSDRRVQLQSATPANAGRTFLPQNESIGPMVDSDDGDAQIAADSEPVAEEIVDAGMDIDVAEVSPAVNPMPHAIVIDGGEPAEPAFDHQGVRGGGVTGVLTACGVSLPAVVGGGDKIRATKNPPVATAREVVAPAFDAAASETPVCVAGEATQDSVDAMDELQKYVGVLHQSRLEEEDVNILALVRQLGGNGYAYRKERAKAVQRIVSEIYSPPRVTAAAKLLPELKCIFGFALDLIVNDEHGNPWDFDAARRRERARKMVEQQKPMLSVGSQVCTAFSAWQHINKLKRDAGVVSREYHRAMVHIRFCMQLYQMQIEGGRYFIHEHPSSATSWAESEVRRIMQMDVLRVASADQCHYNATTRSGEPLKKPTRFMTNSLLVAEALGRRCSGSGGICSRGAPHALCNGQRAKDAAIYPIELCRAILVGIHSQMIADGRLKPGEVCLNCVLFDCGEPRAVEENYVVGDAKGNILKLSIQSDEKLLMT